MRPLFVFRTPFYSPQYQEFYNAAQLKEFLMDFDFMQPHKISRLPTGLPEFQLGTKLVFEIDGYFGESDVRWGPRFIAGRNVNIDSRTGRVYADVPLDSHVGPQNGIIRREYCKIPFRRNMADAVIDLSNLRQLWPVCENSCSEFIKFLTYVSRERYKIHKR